MSLPCPEDPNFVLPDLGEDAFFSPKGQEDEALLATGAFGPPDEEKDKPRPRVQVHYHRGK
jgi:hypothetical protein